MPKLLVLVAGSDDRVMEVAEAVHEGARSVRFAESDVRRIPGEAGTGRLARLRVVEDVEEFLPYDAIAIGAPSGSVGQVQELLARAESIGLAGKLANKLGSIVPAANTPESGAGHPLWPLLGPMARYGMILVPPGYAGPGGAPEGPDAAARRLGKRLIDIAAWITHARSHHHH